ncbi:MAG: T9SS type A sorting domain-containing protein [Bacteroidetes bacterium]|nr:T9SS type A sorting domain-containing protein [Bacteroidota bacterium]MBS1630519.1 T9SS type A sorting domain-containing protein [Bacteroidota bacterium]
MLRRILGLFFLGIASTSLSAQTTADYAIPITVQTQSSPPKILLQWKPRTGATSYTVSRKAKSGTSFTLLATLGANDSSYTDASVSLDSCYEYAVLNAGTIAASGYVLAGIHAAPLHHRGTLILLVDSTFTDSCRAELTQLMNDLRGDGWDLIRHDLSRSAKDTFVKSIILNDYATRSGVNALFILGHIAVPYSGDLNPDGHPDHRGAWPTDNYYSDLNGNWTDAIVNDVTASRSQNDNIPGDGKWDPSFLPTDVELQTGRVDFANMPSMHRSEWTLMRNYLYKAHAYKTHSLPIRRKALVDDNFGVFYGEAFAANAWRNFPVLVGKDNIVAADMMSTLKDSAYQWAYGCGGGTYTSAGGIGKTSDYDSTPVKGIFMMTFGSYFGDWDATDNFLRAPLCAPEPALVNAWAGRPNWFIQAMGLGESIGYCARITQNNTSLYSPANYGAHWIHVGLMGDPSLRDEYIKPVTGVRITADSLAGAALSWTASADTGLQGYYIYRSDSAWRDYQLISSLISGNNFLDTTGINGEKYYLIRPVKLQTTPSGSYVNLGLGIMDSAFVSYPTGIPNISTAFAPKLYPNPATTTLNIIPGASSNTPVKLTIMDVSGRIVLYKEVPSSQATQVIRVDVSRIPVGNYLLEWGSSQGCNTQKWTKW